MEEESVTCSRVVCYVPRIGGIVSRKNNEEQFYFDSFYKKTTRNDEGKLDGGQWTVEGWDVGARGRGGGGLHSPKFSRPTAELSFRGVGKVHS